MSDKNGAAGPPASELPQAPPIRIGWAQFVDAEELGAATRQAHVELQVTGGVRYRGELLDLETPDVGIQWGFHGVPMIAQGPVWADGAFLARWGGRGTSRANGEELGAGVIYSPPGSEHQSSTEGPVGWVSVRVSELQRLAATLAPQLDLGAGSPLRHVESAPGAVAALVQLLGDARRAAESGGGALRDPAARRALHETLGAALVRIVAADRPRRRRESIAGCSALVRLAVEALRARGFRPVYVSELCAAVGSGEARLREAFLRVYGVAPTRYLRLRRLHLVRRALKASRAEELSVSAAASRFGFFEFGRFAGEYRSAFGELPSRTRRTR